MIYEIATVVFVLIPVSFFKLNLSATGYSLSISIFRVIAIGKWSLLMLSLTTVQELLRYMSDVDAVMSGVDSFPCGKNMWLGHHLIM